MPASTDCIYCGAPVDLSAGQGDHVIPDRWGEFREAPTFRGICKKCHGEIDKSIEQLIRCGPESLLSQIVGPQSKRSRRRSKGIETGAHGAPPPKSTISHGDHYAIVERTSDPATVEAVDQLVVTDLAGNERQIKLVPDLRPEQLQARLQEIGVSELVNARLQCDDKNWDCYRAMIESLWPHLQITELPSLDAGIHRLPGRITFTITDRYFRAVAKVAFHYYLLHTLRGFTGHEDNFAELRDFILNGGDPSHFFMTTPRLPFANVERTSQWSHVLMVNESTSPIIAYVHFFSGPAWSRPPYYVRLGPLTHDLLVRSYAWGHRFVYDNTCSSSGRYAGFVEPLKILALPTNLWVPRG
jgi:hypothetical protein